MNTINYNDIGNKNFDNGMNSEDRKKVKNIKNNRMNGVNLEEFNKVTDFNVEYKERKNIGINNIILLNKKDMMERNINRFRNSLIKFLLKNKNY